MNIILFNKLNELNDDLIVSFFDSYINENDYFNCDRDNLIALKDYLIELKIKKRNFDIKAGDIVSRLKQRDSDIISIEPYFDDASSLVIFKKNELLITQNNSEELSNLIKTINYTKEKKGFISASNNFIINPLCFSVVQILLKDKILLAELFLNNNDYEVRKFNKKYLKPYTKDNIKKIYLTK